MGQPCDREGVFKAAIVGYGLKEMQSGSVSVAIRAKLLQYWDGHEWHPWQDYDMEAEGDVWIVKTDGSINQPAAESLMKHAGWDGLFDSVANETWQPTDCQVTVKREEYKGNVRFKVSFVNDLNRTPGGMSNIGPDKARELQNKFGSQLRALAGNTKRNAMPTNRPAPPPPPPRVPVSSEIGPPPGSDPNDIPF